MFDSHYGGVILVAIWVVGRILGVIYGYVNVLLLVLFTLISPTFLASISVTLISKTLSIEFTGKLILDEGTKIFEVLSALSILLVLFWSVIELSEVKLLLFTYDIYDVDYVYNVDYVDYVTYVDYVDYVDDDREIIMNNMSTKLVRLIDESFFIDLWFLYLK